MQALPLDSGDVFRAEALLPRLQLLGQEGAGGTMTEAQRRRLARAARMHRAVLGRTSVGGKADGDSIDRYSDTAPAAAEPPIYNMPGAAAALDAAGDVMRKRVSDMMAKREAAVEREARMNPDLDIMRDVRRAASNASVAHMAASGEGSVPQFDRWKPRAELIGSSSRVAFIPDQVMYAAEGDGELDECLQQQKRICRGCRNPIRKKGFSFGSGNKYEARFCYYTGYYYCRECHTNTRRCKIPARCLVEWDFAEYPVSDKAGDYLEMINEQPLFCISAHRPQLYQRCPLLGICRQMRLQLALMFEIGKDCARFRASFFVIPKAAMQTSLHDEAEGHHAPAYVPPDKRYLVEDSECWSLSDLNVFKDSVPTLPEGSDPRAEAFAGSPARSRRGVRLTDEEQHCPMMQYLRRLRSQMVRHIAHGCAGHCHEAAAKACGACTVDEVIYSFDVDNVVTCSRCQAAFHRHCWETKITGGCPNCAARIARETARRGD